MCYFLKQGGIYCRGNGIGMSRQRHWHIAMVTCSGRMMVAAALAVLDQHFGRGFLCLAATQI